MKKSDFEKCCQHIEQGADVIIRNVVSREKGQVLFCTSDRFHVDIEGKRDSWLPQVCESERGSFR